MKGYIIASKTGAESSDTDAVANASSASGIAS